MNTHKASPMKVTRLGWLLGLLTVPVSPILFAQSIENASLTQEMFAGAIRVDGRVISWPGGGWYQVQNMQDFSEICNGFIGSCEVESPGTYKVTNHTLGLLLSVDVGLENSGGNSGTGGNQGGSTTPVSSGIPYADGDTIRWDSPFWYQVQSRASSEIVCQGGSECVVENGNYWVTQHRPNGGSGWLVVVDESFEGDNPVLTQDAFAAAISVNGNVISWPAGGWYQVQNTQDFSEVCNGNISSCDVGLPGTYKVLNHSLGLRMNVDVGQGTNPGAGGVQLNGLVLSWPDDGWYQVQLADTFETVCEGGTSCRVYPGADFIVINHTTGQRETVRVGEDTDTQDQQELGLPDVNEETAVQLMRQVFEIYNGRAYDARIFESAPLDSFRSGISVIDRLTPPADSNSSLLSSTNYSCGNGGIINEIVEIPGQGINERRYKLTYTDCQINNELINGYVQHYDSSFGAVRYEFEQYTVEFASGGHMAIDGLYFQTDNNSSPNGDVIERNSVYTRNLDYFFQYSDSSLRVNTLETNFDYLVYGNISSLASARIDRSINMDRNHSFGMTLPGDDNEYVVELLSPMDTAPGNTLPIFQEFQLFNTGLISVTSVNDGSFMLFDANGGSGSGVNITLDYSGSETSYSWESWSDIFQTCCTSVQ